MNDLEQENLRLKRELSEAREQMDTFINQWSETNNSLQRENLALSLAYQRQKDALRQITKHQTPMGSSFNRWHEEICQIAFAALAETPDVSLWQTIDSAPKDGTLIFGLLPLGKFIGWRIKVVRFANLFGRPDWYDEDEEDWAPEHWMPLPPPPTLQPDHQK